MATKRKTTTKRNPFSDMEGDLKRAVAADPVPQPTKKPRKARGLGSGPVKSFQGAVTAELAKREPTDAEHNAKYKVMEFKPEPSTRVEVYLLPPFANFRGFGGSRSGLMVGKTPSLVVRAVNSGWGSRDVEYDLANPEAWKAIVAGHKAAVMLEYYQN